MKKQMNENMTSISVLAKADVAAIRREIFDGVDHLVVPIIALVEGVIQASNSPIPELATADVFGQFPLAWNGRPVTLDHPEVNGQKVSASQTPSIFEQESIGFLFNSRIEDGKLKTEAWINTEKVISAGSTVEREISRLESGQMVEVSTGLFTEVEMRDGSFNGRNFNGIWTSIMPDHLAILPEGTTGACSVADGCGGPRLNKENTDMCDDKLKASSSFFKDLRETFEGIFKTNIDSQDTQSSLLTALKAEDADKSYDIVAIFDEEFIFSEGLNNELYCRGFSNSEKGGTILGEGRVNVRPVTEFVPIIKTEELSMKENTKVNELIANAATQFSENDKEWLSSLSDENLDKLVPVEVEAKVKDNAEAEKKVEVKEEVKIERIAEEVKVKDNASKTVDEFIATAPAEMQEVLNAGIRMHREEKEALVSELKANERCSFSEDDLRSMSLENIKKLSQLGNLPSYEGQAGNITANAGADEDQTPSAPEVFDFKK